MAITWLGVAEFLRGRWPEALACFREAAAEEPPEVLDGTGTAFLFELLAHLGEADAGLAVLDPWDVRLPQAGEPASWGVWQMLFSAVEGLVLLHTRRWFARMLLERRGSGDKRQAAQLLAEASEGYQRLGMPRHQAMAETAGAGL